MRNKHFLFATLLLLPMFTIAQSQKKVAVYVMGEDAGINKVLGSKLVSAIARSEEYTAIERTSAFLAELSKEQSYQRTGAVDDSELSRLGKQFGVQYVCVAAVSEVFNEKYLSVRLIDVESGEIERTASSSGAIQSLPDLLDAANTISNELLSSLGNSRRSYAKKVAVYIVKNEAAKAIGRVLGDKLVASFTKSGRYVAIERTNSFLAQLNKEQNYQRTGAVDDKDISRLGKQFGVQFVCVADISEVFGEKYISSRLINVETAEVVNTHDVGGVVNNMEDCIRMANEIASELSKGTFEEQAQHERQLREDSIKQYHEYDILADRHKNYIDSNGKYVDLGLPSGILWKETNEKHEYDYYSAMEQFGNKLPTVKQWEELKKFCRWEWKKGGYTVIGPNNKSIFLRATRSQDGASGVYWAYKYGVAETSARCLCFDSNDSNLCTEIATANGGVCLVDAEWEEILDDSIDFDEKVDSLHRVAEKDPEFPGGNSALFHFLSHKVKYPVIAQEQGIQGRVMVYLIVEKSGRITNIRIRRAPKGGGLSEEAIRVTKLFPRFNPGLTDNRPVRCYFAFPITFRLQ